MIKMLVEVVNDVIDLRRPPFQHLISRPTDYLGAYFIDGIHFMIVADMHLAFMATQAVVFIKQLASPAVGALG